jgi:hypothetical protein
LVGQRLPQRHAPVGRPHDVASTERCDLLLVQRDEGRKGLPDRRLRRHGAGLAQAGNQFRIGQVFELVQLRDADDAAQARSASWSSSRHCHSLGSPHTWSKVRQWRPSSEDFSAAAKSCASKPDRDLFFIVSWYNVTVMPKKNFICSICRRKVICFPVLSRKDNKTEICSKCGAIEALHDFSLWISRKNAD